MKALSVTELAGLRWDTPVHAVTGVVQMVHPKMGGTHGWSLQNGRLEDATGRVVVEFMLSKHPRYWEPEQVRGRWVEFHSTREDDLVWRAQKPKPKVNNGRPFAKLEVAASVRIVFPDAAAPVLPGLEAAAPLPLPEAPRVPVPVAATAQPPAGADLRVHLRQMLGLHAEVEKFVAEEVSPAERPVLSERLFAQACAAGLFLQIDPGTVAEKLGPDSLQRLKPNLAKLADLARGREEMLNLLLRGTGVLRMDATWQSLSEEEAARVLAREDLVGVFVAKAS